MFVFAIIFKVLPDVKIKWKDVWVGSFVTTVLFTLGKFLEPLSGEAHGRLCMCGRCELAFRGDALRDAVHAG